MVVRDVMNKNTQFVTPDTKLFEIARMMREGDFGAVPICEGNKIKGIITDRDITIRAVADCLDVQNTTAEEVMTDDILTCFEDDEIDEVVQTMGENQVRRVAVINRDNKLVGIVSLADLARRERISEQAEVALTKISRPDHHEPQASRH